PGHLLLLALVALRDRGTLDVEQTIIRMDKGSNRPLPDRDLHARHRRLGDGEPGGPVLVLHVVQGARPVGLAVLRLELDHRFHPDGARVERVARQKPLAEIADVRRPAAGTDGPTGTDPAAGTNGPAGADPAAGTDGPAAARITGTTTRAEVA